MEPPQAELLARYQSLQAIGVAGMTRAMDPKQMEQTLRPAFEALQQLGGRMCIIKSAPPESVNDTCTDSHLAKN
ncbi:hypothetical protein [Pontibacter qinzhouensis]|uniref:hypothetical protein n=1 Tax=Pontibacter qinzhouensis TaxID=2603253 RepID=UPI0021067068|nr:hypothetical protein [Pontibacter qinzhouensis]